MKPEELQKIREKAKARVHPRSGEIRVRIVVGMGTSGIAVGARRVLKALLEEVSRRNLPDVAVTQTGERGLTVKEPVVEVHEGERVTVYGEVDEDLARRIVVEHVVNGRPIQERIVEVREVVS